MTTPGTAVQFGVGPIGGAIADVAIDRGFDFVGAIDIDPSLVGQDLGTAIGRDDPIGVEISDDATGALESAPDVVFHSTVSSLQTAAPQLELALNAGATVISTTEELAYPWLEHPTLGEQLHEAARTAGQTLVGTGINPGFAMDLFPATLTTACQDVDRIEITRVQDAATRRKGLQQKIGVGVDPATFESEIAADAGHVGLPESTAMISDAIGWEIDSVQETIEPVITKRTRDSEFYSVEPGSVVGLRQRAVGTVDGEDRIVLDLEMALEAPNPRDEVVIEGTPDLRISVDGGFHGDITTPAIVVNVARRARTAEPGLQTMLDLGPVSWYPHQ